MEIKPLPPWPNPYYQYYFW